MALSKLAVKRLTKWAEFMAALPRGAEKHFDMGHWFGHEGSEEDAKAHGFKRGAKLSGEKHIWHCGTSACALGWATAVPSFARAGLHIKMNSEADGEVVYKGRQETNAAAKFFDIHHDQATHLVALYAETPKQWARGLRKFIMVGGDMRKLGYTDAG